MTSTNLLAAKREKNNEFYTLLSTVEDELKHYKDHFKGKTVLCNCDDPTKSNFWNYFHFNFSSLGLKRLISTHYDPEKPTYAFVYEGGNDADATEGTAFFLEGTGDFASPECVRYLEACDIVVTNPPFSEFRSFVKLLMEHNKKFVIIGNINAVTYKEIFPLIKENKIWAGSSFNRTIEFLMPNSYELKGKAFVDADGRKHGFVPGVCWYTNLEIPKRNEPIDLVEHFYEKDGITPKSESATKFLKIDNYDAINVNRTSDIPCDYFPCWYKCPHAAECIYAQTEGKTNGALCENACNGVLAVPISFLSKYSPKQFEIVGLAPERLPENESILQIKRYKKAVQHKKDGSICVGKEINSGPVIAYSSIPNKYPYYTSETAPNKYLEVLYARILIKRKEKVNEQ